MPDLLSGTSLFEWSNGVAVVAQGPDFPATRYQLGMKYADRRQYEQAASQFDKVIQLHPGHSMALNNLGNCHFALGNLSQATSDWSKAWEADHSNAKAAYNLGFAAERAGDIDAALHYYRIYLSLVPQPPPQIHSRIQDLEGRR
jgi:tetratricopeptide (TPR) repeat protein